MTIAYTSGNHSVATAVSLPEFTAPIPGVNIDYLLAQDFQQLEVNYVPLALNTPHPHYADFLLVSEGEKKDVGGNRVQWTRIYAKIPDVYTEPGGSTVYEFIGFDGFLPNVGLGTDYAFDAPVARQPKAELAQVQITHDFFLVGPGETYETWEDIPLIAVQTYRYVDSSQNVDTKYLTDVPPFLRATVPTKEEYQAMITADEGDTDSFSIVTESNVTRWQGNIFERETRRVKAV